MSLEKTDTVDAVGFETGTNSVVLTIADSWDWSDERAHLLALQAKLNCYLDFIEDGQLDECYPDATGRKQVIDLISRYPLPAIGTALLHKAQAAAAALQIEIRSRCVPGNLPDP
jgi:hypothetical protein